MADREHGGGLAVAREVGKRGPQECVVTRFEAPGLQEPQGPWRCVAAGGAGSFWNRGDVF